MQMVTTSVLWYFKCSWEEWSLQTSTRGCRSALVAGTASAPGRGGQVESSSPAISNTGLASALGGVSSCSFVMRPGTRFIYVNLSKGRRGRPLAPMAAGCSCPLQAPTGLLSVKTIPLTFRCLLLAATRTLHDKT